MYGAFILSDTCNSYMNFSGIDKILIEWNIIINSFFKDRRTIIEFF